MNPPIYDVFLNFRGADTRNCFANNLYKALSRRAIYTFFDDEELQTGDRINPSLVEAIKKSRLAIPIFSSKYLESNACLIELTEISKHMPDEFILPIFYNIDPKTLRVESQTGEMKGEWRFALKQTTRIKGWSFKIDGTLYEYQFIEKVVDEISKKLDRPSNTIPSSTIGCRVGLESRVDEVCLLLNGESNERINMVGITGIGGIGKTTLAQAVYDTLANQHKYMYFLSNVREKTLKVDGLAKLQKKLLSNLYMENSKRHPIEILKNRLKKHKVLLVLDDVDNLRQLKALALREWFFPGSKIIITTRNKKLLDSYGVESIYEVKELNKGDAHKLLHWHAFGTSEASLEYNGVLNEALDLAKGHPLVLEALGSNLHGLTVKEWESALEIYAKNPSRLQWCDKDIQKTLEVSYNGLTEAEKEIFLDIACFYKGERLDYVKDKLFCSHGFNPEHCIRILIDKLLIKIGQDGCLDMHDLYEEMGKEIVMQPSKLEPGRRSILWSFKDIHHVLENDMGTGEIKVIKLLEYDDKKIEWNGEAFRKMYNLRELCIKGKVFSTEPKFLPSSLRVLEWHGYPSSSLPSGFDPCNLAILNLHDCRVELEKPLQRFKILRELILDNCQYITQVPDLSGSLMLEIVDLNYCQNLFKIDDSVGYLPKLRKFMARSCHRLKIFPRALKLPSLEILELIECWNLQKFPEILVTMKNVKSIHLNHSGIVKIPESIENLIGLECLHLNGCKRLCQMPMGSIAKLSKLENLIAGLLDYGKLGCCKGQEEVCNDPKLWMHVESLKLDHSNFSDGSLPRILCWFPNLRELDLSFSNFEVLPACIEDCLCLEKLDLNGCYPLQEIEGIPPNIKRLSAVNTSLSYTSSSLLLSQELHIAGNTNFILPGNSIPNWFHYECNAHKGCFWIRKKFPDIIMCVKLHAKLIDEELPQELPRQFGFDFEVSINGARGLLLKEGSGSFNFIHFELIWNHIYLVDLTTRIQKLELQLENSKREWNLVEISCPQNSWFSFNSSNHGDIRGLGVYIYNLESYAKNISLVDPDYPYRRMPCAFRNLVPNLNFVTRVVRSKFTGLDANKRPFLLRGNMRTRVKWDKFIRRKWDSLETEEDSNSNVKTSQNANLRRKGTSWYQIKVPLIVSPLPGWIPSALDDLWISSTKLVGESFPARILEKKPKLKNEGRLKDDINPQESTSTAPRWIERRKHQEDSTPINPLIIQEGKEEKEEEKGKETVAEEEEATKSNEGSMEKGHLCIIPYVPPNMPSTPILEVAVLQSDSFAVNSKDFSQEEDQEAEGEVPFELKAKVEFPFESKTDGGKEKSLVKVHKRKPKVQYKPTRSKKRKIYEEAKSKKKAAMKGNQLENPSSEQLKRKATKRLAEAGEDYLPKKSRGKGKLIEDPDDPEGIGSLYDLFRDETMQNEYMTTYRHKKDGKKWVNDTKQKTARVVEEGGAIEHQTEVQDQPLASAVQHASNSPRADQIEGLSERVTRLESEIADLKQLTMDQFSHLFKLLSGSALSS